MRDVRAHVRVITANDDGGRAPSRHALTVDTLRDGWELADLHELARGLAEKAGILHDATLAVAVEVRYVKAGRWPSMWRRLRTPVWPVRRGRTP